MAEAPRFHIKSKLMPGCESEFVRNGNNNVYMHDDYGLNRKIVNLARLNKPFEMVTLNTTHMTVFGFLHVGYDRYVQPIAYTYGEVTKIDPVQQRPVQIANSNLNWEKAGYAYPVVQPICYDLITDTYTVEGEPMVKYIRGENLMPKEFDRRYEKSECKYDSYDMNYIDVDNHECAAVAPEILVRFLVGILGTTEKGTNILQGLETANLLNDIKDIKLVRNYIGGWNCSIDDQPSNLKEILQYLLNHQITPFDE